MDKPQLTQLPNYQNYQNAIKVKMTILKLEDLVAPIFHIDRPI